MLVVVVVEVGRITKETPGAEDEDECSEGEKGARRPRAGGKKRFEKRKKRIHAWISNFTAEHLVEIAGLEKKNQRSFLFSPR